MTEDEQLFYCFIDSTDLLFYGEFESMFLEELDIVLAYCAMESKMPVINEMIERYGFWTMISFLNNADMVEYGTSPRTAWLTDKGKRLHAFISSKSLDELEELLQVDYQDRYAYDENGQQISCK